MNSPEAKLAWSNAITRLKLDRLSESLRKLRSRNAEGYSRKVAELQARRPRQLQSMNILCMSVVACAHQLTLRNDTIAHSVALCAIAHSVALCASIAGSAL